MFEEYGHAQTMPNISQSDSDRNDPVETTENRNDPESGFRLKVLDFIFMGKKESIVHSHFTQSRRLKPANYYNMILSRP